MTLDILAIAAHPDDVEQTCGGTLIRMAEQGYRTGVLDLTAGDMGTRGIPGSSAWPNREMAGRHLQLAWRDNQHMPDARLENTLGARMTLAVRIRELKPRVVILPYWEARHPDQVHCAELGCGGLFPGGAEEVGRVLRAAPARANPVRQLLRGGQAKLRGGHQRAIRPARGGARRLRLARQPRRSFGAYRSAGPIPWQPDRIPPRRAFHDA